MGRVAIVTGGASGIGFALASAAARRGADVIVADIDEAAAEDAAGRIGRAEPGTAAAAALDVADPDAVQALVDRTVGERGRLDFMFNNAGIGMAGEPEELGLEHWERALDVNLRGVIHGCHAAYPVMKAQGTGRIVNTGSIAGLIGGLAASGPYVATKHAVVGLSLSLRVTAAEFGVGVHVVCPGAVETPLLDRSGAPGLPTPPSMRGVTMRTLAVEAGMGRFYPAERLAEDVMRGLARNRPVIIAPLSARVGVAMWKALPGPIMAAMQAGQAAWRREHQPDGAADQDPAGSGATAS